MLRAGIHGKAYMPREVEVSEEAGKMAAGDDRAAWGGDLKNDDADQTYRRYRRWRGHGRSARLVSRSDRYGPCQRDLDKVDARRHG